MQTLTIFDAHFRAAQTLLKVYRLLDSTAGVDETRNMLPTLRDLAHCDDSEHLVLLFNDLFLGLVRESAEVPPYFFRPANLALLLRQAVVSAYSAMDVFFPALLEAHLPLVVQVRQRNFLPTDAIVRNQFKDFQLGLDDLPALLEEESAQGRWMILTRRILDYCQKKTLSNVDAISAVMLILGVTDPWKQVSRRAGMPETALRGQLQTLSKRRNDIVHRGDRPAGVPDAPAQAIDYPWTSSHVSAVQSVVLACDALAREAMAALALQAGAA